MKRYLPLLLALGLGACGGSSGGPITVTHTVTSPTRDTTSTTSPSTTSASTATTSATTATTPTTTPTTTTSAPAGTPPCVAADLALSYLGQQGAAGHGEIGFALRNTSGHPCHTIGYPGVLFLDRHGSALATVPHHTTLDYFGHTPVTVVTLPPGSEASFRMGVTHGAIPGSVCTTAYGLQVIPPNDTATLHISIPDGAYECRDATVSPLAPGPTAYR